MRRERIIKKHVKRAGWYVVHDTPVPSQGHRLVLRNRATGRELKVDSPTRPRAWRRAGESIAKRERLAA